MNLREPEPQLNGQSGKEGFQDNELANIFAYLKERYPYIPQPAFSPIDPVTEADIVKNFILLVNMADFDEDPDEGATSHSLKERERSRKQIEIPGVGYLWVRVERVQLTETTIPSISKIAIVRTEEGENGAERELLTMDPVAGRKILERNLNPLSPGGLKAASFMQACLMDRFSTPQEQGIVLPQSFSPAEL